MHQGAPGGAQQPMAGAVTFNEPLYTSLRFVRVGLDPSVVPPPPQSAGQHLHTSMGLPNIITTPPREHPFDVEREALRRAMTEEADEAERRAKRDSMSLVPAAKKGRHASPGANSDHSTAGQGATVATDSNYSEFGSGAAATSSSAGSSTTIPTSTYPSSTRPNTNQQPPGYDQGASNPYGAGQFNTRPPVAAAAGPWNCTMCTYQNPSSESKCQMCGGR